MVAAPIGERGLSANFERGVDSEEHAISVRGSFLQTASDTTSPKRQQRHWVLPGGPPSVL